MKITEEQKDQLNQFLRKYRFNTISGNELTAEIANQADNDGVTPLFIAAQDGHLDIAQELIKAGADPDKAKTASIAAGVTPLYTAAQQGHLEIVKELIKAGADPDKARYDGTTPLYMAAQQGHLEIVQALIEAGAEIDKLRTNDGVPPLHIGVTPLHIAAHNGRTATAQLLLFATKLSTRPNIRFTLPQTMHEDPIIGQILKCDQQGQFNSLRNNLRLIAKADKKGLNPEENQSLGFVRRLLNKFSFFQNTETKSATTNPINTSQIVLKALYEHFRKDKNLPELLETFTTKTTQLIELNRFNLNDPKSLLLFLSKSDEEQTKSGREQIPEIVTAKIAEYAGAFSNKRLEDLLEAYFNGEKQATELMKATAEAEAVAVPPAPAEALTQEEIPTALQSGHPDELITRLGSLSSLPYNVINNNGTYIYLYDDEGNRGAAMAEKPINQLTESELANLYSEIQRLEAAQPARQEVEERHQEPSHVERLAEQRTQEKARGAQPNGR